MKVRVDELKPHPRNQEFFSDMTGDQWEKFLISIEETGGPVEPIIITEDNVIVSGHQRVRACRELGIETVNAEVRQYNGKEFLEVSPLITFGPGFKP